MERAAIQRLSEVEGVWALYWGGLGGEEEDREELRESALFFGSERREEEREREREGIGRRRAMDQVGSIDD